MVWRILQFVLIILRLIFVLYSEELLKKKKKKKKTYFNQVPIVMRSTNRIFYNPYLMVLPNLHYDISY